MTTTKQKNNEFEHQLTDPKEVKNLKEAKKLVELFRRITLSQIKEKWGQLYDCIVLIEPLWDRNEYSNDLLNKIKQVLIEPLWD